MNIFLGIVLYLSIGLALAIIHYDDTVMKNKDVAAIMMILFWPYYWIVWGTKL